MAGMLGRLLAVVLAVAPLGAQVKLTQAPGRISVDINGKAFTEFFIGPEAP
jgi:hypothetical protein